MKETVYTYRCMDGKAYSNKDESNIDHDGRGNPRPMEVMKESSHLLKKGDGEGASILPTKDDILSRNASLLLTIAIIVLSLSVMYVYMMTGSQIVKLEASGAFPFESVTHLMQPSSYWGVVSKPYPTGAFWTNLVVDNSAGQTNSPAAVLPYGISCTSGGVQVSYGATRRVITQLQITDPFAVDLQIGSQEAVVSWAVSKYDNLSVAIQFDTESGGTFTNYMVKSSPYVTVVFDGTTPVISAELMKIINVDKKHVDGNKDGTYYQITLGNYQNWFLYCSQAINSLTSSIVLARYFHFNSIPSLSHKPKIHLCHIVIVHPYLFHVLVRH